MNQSLSDPKVWLLLICLGGMVVGLNLTLIGLWRGNRSVQAEASRWGKALRGGQDARQQQEAQLAELHRLVGQIRLEESAPPDEAEKPE